MRTILRHAFVTLTLLAGSSVLLAAGAPSTAETLQRFRVEEAAAPAKDSPQWRAPKKVLLLQFGNPVAQAGSSVWSGREAAFMAAAPQARIVTATDVAAAVVAAADVDAIIGFNPEICDPRIVSAAKQLRWIASLSAGVELCTPQAALRDRKVLMTNMRGVDSPAIAEHAIAMMLALAHGLDRFAVDTASGQWNRNTVNNTPIQMLEGKTLLVVGLGGIGTEVAERAHGLGMNVVATRDRGTGKPDSVSYIGQPDELLALARTADVIISAVPLTPQTQGLFNAGFFAVLKPTAYFINIARGGSVVTTDLIAALNEKRLAGAGLDVVDPEPLPAGHPLWRAPRVLISPHISSRSDLPGEARWILAVENLRRYAAGEKMFSVVDIARGY